MMLTCRRSYFHHNLVFLNNTLLVGMVGIIATIILLIDTAECLNLFGTIISRREAFSVSSSTIISSAVVLVPVEVAVTTAFTQQPAWSVNDDDIIPSSSSIVRESEYFNFENRDRKNNKDAIIREDYWYLTGRVPPRKLEVTLNIDDPQWNAFGTCETSADGGSNSCTYVSLKQRIPAYSKYGFGITDGAKEYQKLGYLLDRIATTDSNNNNNDDNLQPLWDEAYSYVMNEEKTAPPAIIDAELKMVLFATAMLSSPNFPKPGKELLIARFYANEVRYARTVLSSAILSKDLKNALAAWNFGKDSWNSYFQVVNKSITQKVGDPFPKMS